MGKAAKAKRLSHLPIGTIKDQPQLVTNIPTRIGLGRAGVIRNEPGTHPFL